MNKIMVLVTFISLSFLLNTVSSSFNPTVENIDVDSDGALSTVTFTATIKGVVEQVRLIANECSEIACFAPGFNVSMDAIDTKNYRAQITLTHEDAVKIQYFLNIRSNGVWHKSDMHEVNLTASDNEMYEVELMLPLLVSLGIVILGIIILALIVRRRKNKK